MPLSAEQLAVIRRKFVRVQTPPIDFGKPTINAALQAIEDWYEANKAQISTDIDTATAPYVFTGPQKKLLGALWFQQKAQREGA